MAWRNDTQAARAISLLLERTGLPALRGLFGLTGPSNRAWELYDAKGGPLSSGEAALVLAAFAFWNGAEELPFAKLIHDLDLERAALCCELAVAVQEGPSAVDEWIESHKGDARRERRVTHG